MATDLRAQLEAFQRFVDEVSRDLDRLSHEQRELLRTMLERIDQEKIVAIRDALKHSEAT